MPKVTIPPMTPELAYSHPVSGGGLGPYAHAMLGDPVWLTQFGVHSEVLPAGSRSSFRHWHETEDEMIAHKDGAARHFTYSDGRPRNVGGKDDRS